MTVTEDTQATLLLCARLSQQEENGAKTLQAREYAVLAKWLKEHELQPGDLLHAPGRARLAGMESNGIALERLESLLDRGAALGLLLEQWEGRGLWVVSLGDPEYPSRYVSYMENDAPPLLYGIGSQRALRGGGLAIAGSRDAGDEDLAFARDLGARCARQGVLVVSGAAKGIDSEAMMAGLEEGGHAVGVLAEGLGRASVAPQYRDAIISGRLTLISAYEPDSHWFAFKAMGRNKMIYALADAAVVVSSSDQSGGTWAGATEALKRGRVPVYVKSTGAVSKGNEKLMRAGAQPLLPSDWEDLPRLVSNPAPTAGLFQQ